MIIVAIASRLVEIRKGMASGPLLYTDGTGIGLLFVKPQLEDVYAKRCTPVSVWRLTVAVQGMEPHLLQREADQAATSAVLDTIGRSSPNHGPNITGFCWQLLGTCTNVTWPGA